MRMVSLCVSLLAGSSYAQAGSAGSPATNAHLPLSAGWHLQSSAKVNTTGDLLSLGTYQPKDWYPVTVPTTVLAALVQHKVYPDPYFDVNIRSIPGANYPIKENTWILTSNAPMPADSPFAVPWWYRKEFVVPANYQGRTIWLNFDGINYRANIWLNGKLIGQAKDLAGAWRTYVIDVTNVARPGAKNVLAVQIFAQTETDLGTTFVDWNPSPPDKNMGLWRDVTITTTGPVALRYPAVLSTLDSPAHGSARLTVTALLQNAATHAVKGKLVGRIENLAFEREVDLAPGERLDVAFEPDAFPQLVMANPRLWWPAQMGTPHLYRLALAFEINGRVSDRVEKKFGIREIKSALDESQRRFFTVNGKKILIRGAGWSSDMLMRESSQRLRDELRYVSDMGLNTVRLEGKLEREEFFDIADRDGILVMAGWCCCNHWEKWAAWKPDDFAIAEHSLRDQLYRMRGHPSLMVWLNGSDKVPPPEVEKTYLNVASSCRWPNPMLSSATAKLSPQTGPSGVKMTGPYEYVAPKYWMEDTKRGGAYGFNTETSTGAAIPVIESLRKMLPKEHLWPINDHWSFHSGGGKYRDLNLFTDALDARYGKANSVEDFAMKSQLMAYEGTRAMFEAYSINKYTATGVIQWMLNNAWPSLIWHLYDYYLQPAGGYFGVKKACAPLHPVYSYSDHSIWVVSSQYENVKDVKLTAKIYNLDMVQIFSRQVTLDAAPDSATRVFTLPVVNDETPISFLRLALETGTEGAGKLIGSNFYWLSAKPETVQYDEKAKPWYATTAAYADYTALARLPKVRLDVTSRTERKAGDVVTHVSVKNIEKTLAFFIRLKLSKGPGGEEILPVLWEDNYFSVMPGEQREITATYSARALGASKPSVAVSGWNLKP